jgi:hypothetical protein
MRDARATMAFTIHVELDLEPNREPIAGTLSGQDFTARPFDGWLELASAIEAARTDGMPVPTTESDKAQGETSTSPRGRDLPHL